MRSYDIFVDGVYSGRIHGGLPAARKAVDRLVKHGPRIVSARNVRTWQVAYIREAKKEDGK